MIRSLTLLRLAFAVAAAALVIVSGPSKALGQCRCQNMALCPCGDYACCCAAGNPDACAAAGGGAPSGGGDAGYDPVLAAQLQAQREREAEEERARREAAQAAFDRARANIQSLSARGRELAGERDAFRALFDGEGSSAGLVLGPNAPVMGGAFRAAPRASGSSPPGPPRIPAQRVGDAPAVPPTALPADEGWQAPPWMGGFRLSPEAVARLQELAEWLRSQLEDQARRLPVIWQLLSFYDHAQRSYEVFDALRQTNAETIDAIFEAAGDVTECMAGAPCNESFVRGLDWERGEAHVETAREQIEEQIEHDREQAEDDDD